MHEYLFEEVGFGGGVGSGYEFGIWRYQQLLRKLQKLERSLLSLQKRWWL
jgi:hypothetical protein